MSKQPLSPRDIDFVKKVGSGSFGVVYCARVKGGGGTLFAVKVLKKRKIISQHASSAVLRERALARSFEHPFVVTLRCSFQSLENLYFCTDFYAGGSLAASLYKRGKFGIESVTFYAAELCSALAYLHSRKVVHRDVKPANILLHQTGHIGLSDFGVSSLMSSSSNATQSSTNSFFSSGFSGTVPYMAPELLLRSADHHFTSSIDWWAFGCTVFELATSRTPFFSKSPRQLFSNILYSPPPDRAGQDRNLSRLLSRVLDKNPHTRAQGNEVSESPFFSRIDWDKLELKLVPPPLGKPALPKFIKEVDGHLQLYKEDNNLVKFSPQPCPRLSQSDDDDNNKENSDGAWDGVIDSFKNFAWTGPADLASSPKTYHSVSSRSLSSSSYS